MDRRLGRGLGALLSDPTEQQQAQEAPAASPTEVALAEVRPNQYQPRLHFDPEGLEELRDSIQAHGVLQPIVVCKREEGYELIAGERRMRAAKMAGLERVPAVIREDLSDQDMLELALVENVQRRDLDPIERAKGYQRLIEELELTQEAVAQRVGLKRATVTNHLRLLELAPVIQESVSQGALSMGHARALLGLEHKDQRLQLAAEIRSEGLSVRQVESRIRELRNPGPSAAEQAAEAEAEAALPLEIKPAAVSSAQREPWLLEMEDRLRRSLGSKVHVDNRQGFKGKIAIEYFGREDLERLYSLLAPREEI